MRLPVSIALCIAICGCNPVLPAPTTVGSGTVVLLGATSSAAMDTSSSAMSAAMENDSHTTVYKKTRAQHTPKDCTALGGTLRTERKPPLGTEFLVCILPSNRQCEIDALASGRCPAHGMQVAGATPAARYCMLIGGRYRKTGMEGEEQGTCTLGRASCNVWDLWDGRCTF